MLHSGSITCLYGQSVVRDIASRQPIPVAGWPRRHARGRSDASTGSTGGGDPAGQAGAGWLAGAGIVPCGISRLRGHQLAGRPAGVGVRVPRRRRADIPGLHGGRAAGPGPAQRPHGAAAGRCFGTPHSENPTSAASTYPFGKSSRLVLTSDNHNSVNGIREFALARGACLAAPSAPRSAGLDHRGRREVADPPGDHLPRRTGARR